MRKSGNWGLFFITLLGLNSDWTGVALTEPELDQYLYNESLPKGTDYTDPCKVMEYDAKMLSFRDYARESGLIKQVLDLKAHQTVVEIGCGTGGLTIHLARCCNRLYGLDVSKTMLDYARKKAEDANVKNITFQQGGFLTHGREDASVDAVVTNAALHHLPDFWKMAALLKINRMMKAEGRLFLGDVIFSYPPEQYKERSLDWIVQMGEKTGNGDEARTHLKEEYSTFSWIMESILEHAGFDWKRVGGDEYYALYLCKKARSFP